MAAKTNPQSTTESAQAAAPPAERERLVVHTPAHYVAAVDEPVSLRKRLLIWGLPALAVLLIGGGLSWFFYFRKAPERLGPVVQSPSATEKKSENSGPAPTRAPEVKPQPPSEADQKKAAVVPLAAPTEVKNPAKKPGPLETKTPEKKPIIAANVDPIPVSVVRLHKQQTTDAAGASRDYDHKLVEIRGNYLGSKAVPTGLRVDFAMDKGQAPCSLTVWPDSLETALRHLVPGQCVTLRGVYEAPGMLHHTQLIQTRTPADDFHQGKLVELVGYVGKVSVPEGDELSSLRFEPGVTDSVIGVECSFKKQEPNQPAGLAPGQFVIVRGRCGIPTFNVVRIHDCQILYDYLPKPDVPRLSIEHFVRDYDRHARDEESIDAGDAAIAVTAAELLEAYKIPAEGFKRFGRRWLEVDATMESVDRSQLAVILEGGTDQGLKAKCLFLRSNFNKLNLAARMTIRGWCNGIDGKFVRLDNCEAIAPTPREKAGPRVDAEFLPFRTGKSLVYDTAVLSPPANRGALRQAFAFKEGRVMEVVAKQTGKLKEKSGGLGVGVDWIKKSPGAAPLVLHYRLRAGHVEIGQSAAGDKAQPNGSWEPVIATGLQAGDSWSWTTSNQKYLYTVVAFSDYAAALSVVIKKTVETPNSGMTMETVHVYARGIGEVERKLYEVPSKGAKRLIMETKLVR